METAAANALLGEMTKPALDKIEPRTGGGSEVQVEAPMTFQPRAHAWMFVRAVVVDNEVQIQTGRSFLIDSFQKADEFLMTMAWHAVSDHFAVQNIQGGEERRGAMAFIVVGESAATAGLHRQSRLGSIQRLDLTLFIHAQNERLLGRIQVEAHHVLQFFHKLRVSAELERFDQMRLEIVLLPGRLVDVIKTWVAYGLTLIPLLVFYLSHPGVLTSRFRVLSYVQKEPTLAATIFRFLKRYFQDLSLWGLLTTGDLNPRHHVPGATGSMLIAPFILALLGITIIVTRRRLDPWWRFVIFGALASVIPGALTNDPFHTGRMIASPSFYWL